MNLTLLRTSDYYAGHYEFYSTIIFCKVHILHLYDVYFLYQLDFLGIHSTIPHVTFFNPTVVFLYKRNQLIGSMELCQLT